MDSSFQQGLNLFQFALDVKGLIAVLAMSTARIYVAMLVMPATNDMLLYGRTRSGLVIVLGAFVAWGQPAEMLKSLTILEMAVLVVKEGLIGMLIGFAVGTVFWVAESVGMLIDNQTGYNNIQQTNPLSGQQSTPVGNLLSQLAIVGFYMLGGMLVFVGLLFDSYEWWPLTGLMPSWPVLMERFLPTEVTNYAETVLKIAGPVIVILMLIDLGIGLLGKAAEKLEPNSLAQPIKGATTMLLLVLLVGVFFQQVRPQLTLRPVAERIKRLLSPSLAPPSAAPSLAVPHG